jgi:hypothetical protein
MRINRSAACAIGVFATLALGAGTAVAANGDSLVLGHNNAETSGTTLTNSHGTALTLNGKTGHPALKVNNTTKIKNLNSDLLDGKAASAFLPVGGTAVAATTAHTAATASAVTVYSARTDSSVPITSTGLDSITVPAGSYLVTTYADFSNPEVTTGDYGCYPQYVTGTASVRGDYADATVVRYGSGVAEEVKTFTSPTTITVGCLIYTGDSDGLAKVVLSSLTATPVSMAVPMTGSVIGAGSTATR